MHPFFVTGGTLKQDAPSYVERPADAELCAGLERGEFCYVLTSRQTGKSSLMVRAANRLRDAGNTVLVLDITSLGRNLSVEQWYYGLLLLVAAQLGLRNELREFWLAHPLIGPLQRWVLALREVVLPHLKDAGEAKAADTAFAQAASPSPRFSRLVVFIDEIDYVQSLPFSTDEFFAGIRECYNRRAADPEFERLTFCFLGVALPSDLIRDPRTTPFNVGRRIVLNDFRMEEAEALAPRLEGNPEKPDRSAAAARQLLRRVMYWTGGHPYLTQRLCLAVATDGSVRSPRDVDRVCRDLFFSPGSEEQDDNLLFVRERLQHVGSDAVSLLELYQQVWKGRRVADSETDPLLSRLRLTGVVREVKGRLQVRTRIYERVFNENWIKTQLPGAERRRQQAAYRRGMLRGAGLALLCVAGLVVLCIGIYHSIIARRERVQSRLERGGHEFSARRRAELPLAGGAGQLVRSRAGDLRRSTQFVLSPGALEPARGRNGGDDVRTRHKGRHRSFAMR